MYAVGQIVHFRATHYSARYVVDWKQVDDEHRPEQITNTLERIGLKSHPADKMRTASRVCVALFGVFLCAAPALAQDLPTASQSARQLVVLGKPQQALIELRKRAEQGDSEAQLYAGIMLATGDGTGIDREGAVRYWRLSAEQNVPEAQFRLGVAYSSGAGVPLDLIEGAKWVILGGAEDGLAFRLISAAISAEEVEEARTRAAAWRTANRAERLRRAMEVSEFSEGSRKTELLAKLAAEGSAQAQFELGKLFERGVPDAVQRKTKPVFPLTSDGREWQPNHEMAVRYFRFAAEQSYAPAEVALAAALEAGHGVSEDLAAAVALYQSAADKGDPHGKWGLAGMLLDGRGTELDSNKGMALLGEVAASGTQYFSAQAELAERYLESSSPDLRLAYMWYAVAADAARSELMDATAADYDQARLGLESLMSTRDIDDAKASAGRCTTTGYKRCGLPLMFDGVLDLLGL